MQYFITKILDKWSSNGSKFYGINSRFYELNNV